MSNRDIEQGWAYHNATKHSYESVRASRHFLDWPNQPRAFKVYTKLDPVGLPREMRKSGTPALDVIAARETASNGEAIPDLAALAQVFYYSAGITRRRMYPGGEILFRAAACTGALYEFELYFACGGLPDLAAGLYHFSPAEMALRSLRAGDWRSVLVRATAGEPSVARAPVTVICAGTYWRNAWKYQARTYRHFGWDNGTLLANLLAETAAVGLPAKLVMGFLDAELNELLGLDTQREVAFSLVALGRQGADIEAAPASFSPLRLETLPLSPKEVDYPLMRRMHDASSLVSAEEVRAWQSPAKQPASEIPAPAGKVVPLEPIGEEELARTGIEDVILRRGSTRVFARVPITFQELSTILDRATRGIAADFLSPSGAQWNDMYLTVHAVEGLASGSYYFRREERSLECLKEGSFRDAAGYLGLEQDLPADCSAAVFFLADLNEIFECYGNRGYRAVQLEAGIIGGKAYLAAYALGLGASGLTFFDDDVTAFFSPHAKGKSAIFLVALGKRQQSR